MPTVSGVLVYTCIQQPTLKYQDKVNKEYKVSIVVDEDTADDWNDKFPKQSTKVVKTSDFKNEYKIDAPFPSEKKQYVITLKKDAQYKDGNPLPDNLKPKVFLTTGSDASGKAIMKDVTKDKLVGNGSIGVVSYETVSNDYGDFARLKNVRVDSLIEYAKRGDGDDDLGVASDDDGSTGFDDTPAPTQASTEQTQAAPRTRSPRTAKTSTPVDAGDDGSPF